MTRFVTSIATSIVAAATIAVALSGCSLAANDQGQACSDFEAAWKPMSAAIDKDLPEVTADPDAWGALSDARDTFVAAAHQVGNGTINPLASTAAERMGTLVDAARLYKQKPTDTTKAALDTASANMTSAVEKIQAVCK
ncbi:hypothetical protein ACL9RL_13570 [Plantibacter sp. Mn2098]|uniref:hypothetical protein n=1 Tax=Plantibacter sp. Mn2098 TaxID=3395266 RepID=UPI003BC65F9A